MPFDVYLNVAIGGVLTGLVYGLMALGLSVIFGVVRVVNFAHGEMMTIAMFIAVAVCGGFHVDPLLLLVPIAAVMFAFGYMLCQSTRLSIRGVGGVDPVARSLRSPELHRRSEPAYH